MRNIWLKVDRKRKEKLKKIYKLNDKQTKLQKKNALRTIFYGLINYTS